MLGSTECNLGNKLIANNLFENYCLWLLLRKLFWMTTTQLKNISMISQYLSHYTCPSCPDAPLHKQLLLSKKKLLCTLPYTYYHITEKIWENIHEILQTEAVNFNNAMSTGIIYLNDSYLIEELLPKYLVMLPLKTPLKITIILSRKQDLEYIKIKGNESE